MCVGCRRDGVNENLRMRVQVENYNSLALTPPPTLPAGPGYRLDRKIIGFKRQANRVSHSGAERGKKESKNSVGKEQSPYKLAMH